MKKEFRSFKDARKYVWTLKLKNQEEWREFYKSEKRPFDIPTTPARTYRNQGWKGMGDWLGTGNIKPEERIFRTFNESKKFVHSLGLKSIKDWRNFCNSNKRPNDIPSSPDKTYKNEWISWGDFLGTGRIANRLFKYRKFSLARKFVRQLKLNGENEWRTYCNSGKKPVDIPRNANVTYKNEWISWGDFLGTANIANQSKSFLSYQNAKRLVKTKKLKHRKDWLKFTTTEKFPLNLPKNPSETYKKDWISWGDFLGTGTIGTTVIHKNYLNFKSAREQARILAKKHNIKTWADWNRAKREGKIPKTIPLEPDVIYSKRKRKRK